MLKFLKFIQAAQDHILTAQLYSEVVNGDVECEDMSEGNDNEHMSGLRSQQQAHRNTILITKYTMLAFLLNITGLLIIYFALSRGALPRGVETEFFPAR